MRVQRFRSGWVQRDSRFGPVNFALWLPLSFLLFVGVGAFMKQLPWEIPSAYAFCSLASAAGYTQDKTKAQRGEWRTPESTLHFLDGLGGWPGGLLAQRLIRHKTRKFSFQCVFWICVSMHVAGWIWVFLKVPAEPDLMRFLVRVVQSFATLFPGQKSLARAADAVNF